ncbi:exonuclease 3'-5' domain-containing protein 1, partial [Lecanoromycetidae sp. Uapishka_2]
MAVTFVDSAAAVIAMVNNVTGLPTSPPSLYFDLEGQELSRTGTISIFQLLVHPQDQVYLIDIHVLGDTAFVTAGTDGNTLRGVLESPSIPKACFDVRNDSDALYHHFGISLQGIHDIQLMENASRGHQSSRRLLNGLIKCIEADTYLTMQEKQAWRIVKDQGVKLFAPEKGGSYEVFNSRPLHDDIKAYCVQDVRLLTTLWDTYWHRLDQDWKTRVEFETRARVQESQSPHYRPHGEHKALGPWPR